MSRKAYGENSSNSHLKKPAGQTSLFQPESQVHKEKERTKQIIICCRGTPLKNLRIYKFYFFVGNI